MKVKGLKEDPKKYAEPGAPAAPQIVVSKGEEAEVSDAMGKRMVELGDAEEVKDAPEKEQGKKESKPAGGNKPGAGKGGK